MRTGKVDFVIISSTFGSPNAGVHSFKEIYFGLCKKRQKNNKIDLSQEIFLIAMLKILNIRFEPIKCKSIFLTMGYHSE